jgi:hypothetical protein
MDRPWILPKQNPSPQGEKYGYFPSENPKNYVFRRAIHESPLHSHGKMRSLTV